MKTNSKLLVLTLAFFSVMTFTNLQAQSENSKVYSVEEFTKGVSGLVGQNVQVKGKVLHICAHTGRKLFLTTADGSQTVRFNAGKEIDVFDENLVDSMVVATGIVAEQRITIDDLKSQEAKLIEADKAKVKAESDHCTTEAKANGENVKATPLQRVQTQIETIKKQVSEGKNNYLSFYSVDDCNKYKVAK